MDIPSGRDKCKAERSDASPAWAVSGKSYTTENFCRIDFRFNLVTMLGQRA